MHQVRLTRSAERSLHRLRRSNPGSYRRVLAAVAGLRTNSRPAGAVKLTAVDPPAWRIRVGDYRIVYAVEDADLLVLVIRVAPRGEVYR